MSCHDKKHLITSRVVRFTCTLLLAGATLLGAPAALAVDTGDVIVASSRGEVHIIMNGAERKVRAGGVLELPASVRTGRDGSVELKQGATTVGIGPETLLEFPALEKRGAPIDRILQPRGNAFYNIGKREGRKLRVETPYLVGVIKGTQFNVAAEPQGTTISLFEGLLEVHASDESDVIDLKAGEIASRKRDDKSIGILKMDAGKAPTTGSRPTTGGAPDNGTPGPAAPSAPRVAPPDDAGDTLLADRVTIDPRADVGASDVAVNAGAARADVITNVGVEVGPAAVEVAVNAAVDIAAGTVDVSTGTTVDAGLVTAGLGNSTSVDLGAGTVDTSATATVDAGPLTTDVATGAVVDLGSGTVDAGLVVGASAPLVEVNVGSDVAADAVAGTVNLGLDIAGADIDVGVDVKDPVAPVTDPVIETVTDTVVDVGGLLNGLIHRNGRK